MTNQSEELERVDKVVASIRRKVAGPVQDAVWDRIWTPVLGRTRTLRGASLGDTVWQNTWESTQGQVRFSVLVLVRDQAEGRS